MRMKLRRPDLTSHAKRFDVPEADGDLSATFLGSPAELPCSGYRLMPLKSRARHRARRRVGDTSLATWSNASLRSPAAVQAVSWVTVPRHHGNYESSDPFSLLGMSATVAPAPSA